jgi:hypothetical protein
MLKENDIKEKYLVVSSNGYYYKLYYDGRIEKPDGYISDGKSWEFVGFVERLPFGRIGPIIKREDCFAIPETEFKFKNGTQKYRVVDRDHGTLRIWS